MNTLTIVTAHPDPKSFSRSLAAAYATGANRAGSIVQTLDATELQFDPVLRGASRTPMHDEPDLARLRAAIDTSAHVAWFFPTWWAGLPAALKGLVDRLFLPNVSFVYEGGLPRGLLKGRSTRTWHARTGSQPWPPERHRVRRRPSRGPRCAPSALPAWRRRARRGEV